LALLDPKGESIFSWAIKKGITKIGGKAVNNYLKNIIKKRIKRNHQKGSNDYIELMSDAEDILSLISGNSSGSLFLDIVEWIPIAGDICGGIRLSQRASKIKDKLNAISVKLLEKSRLLIKQRKFGRRGEEFTLEQGTARSGWKHIFDRHVNPSAANKGKSIFDESLGQEDIVNLLRKTLKHGKESSFKNGERIFTFRANYNGVGYKTYRVTVEVNGKVKTFHPLD